MVAELRKTLGKFNSPYIVSLMRLIETQSKQTILEWCVGYCETVILPVYQQAVPGDVRPEEALMAARRWMQDEIKLPEAKKYILAAHAAAREAEGNPAAQAAARAIGQAASAIHAATHSLGMAFYGAAALAYSRLGVAESAAVYNSEAAKVCADMEKALRALAVENEDNPAKINWRC